MGITFKWRGYLFVVVWFSIHTLKIFFDIPGKPSDELEPCLGSEDISHELFLYPTAELERAVSSDPAPDPQPQAKPVVELKLVVEVHILLQCHLIP